MEPRTTAETWAGLELLGPFVLRIDGSAVRVTRGSERVLALLGLHKRMDRRRVSGMLWPDHTGERAAANLRAAIWRLPGYGRRLIVATGRELALDPLVDCDVDRLKASALDLLEGNGLADRVAELCKFNDDLLPDWDEEWLTSERDWLQQLKMQALDFAAEWLTTVGRSAEAALVAMLAVRADPLRESSQRLLVAAHEANHNHSLAIRQYELYRTLVRTELGIEPGFPEPNGVASRDLAMTPE